MFLSVLFKVPFSNWFFSRDQKTQATSSSRPPMSKQSNHNMTIVPVAPETVARGQNVAKGNQRKSKETDPIFCPCDLSEAWSIPGHAQTIGTLKQKKQVSSFKSQNEWVNPHGFSTVNTVKLHVNLKGGRPCPQASILEGTPRKSRNGELNLNC